MSNDPTQPDPPLDNEPGPGAILDEATGDILFVQPLVNDEQSPAVAPAGRPSGPKSGKAKAKANELGKAKRSAIAKKIERSRWKRARKR
jgi:hypothetical protein